MKFKTCTEYWLDTKNYSFRGEFEKMYQDIGDPWGCHKETFSLNNRIFIEIIFEEKNVYKSILDVGCGIGGLTYYIYKRNGGGDVLGCDISRTAIRKARSLYPDVRFECKDILNDDINDLGKFDLIILSEVLWYILDGVKNVMRKISNALEHNGIFGIHQYFPFEQRFGKNIIDGLEGFENFVRTKTSFHFDKKVLSYGKDGVVLLGSLKHH